MAEPQDPRQMWDDVQKVGRVRLERADQKYSPPPGSPLYEKVMAKHVYEPDVSDLTKTEFLHPFEMKHVFPVAWAVADVFGYQPMPDSLYATVPPEPKASNLFVVVSRTDIRKKGPSGLAWPAILVVVKRIPVVKIICTLDMSRDLFSVRQIILWMNSEMRYSNPITNGGKPIALDTLRYLLDQYKNMEGIQ